MSLIQVGEAVDLNYGRALSARTRRHGTVPVFGSNGQTGWHDEPLIEEPTIVIGRKGSIGEVHYCAVPSHTIDTAYFVTRKKSKPSDLRYLYYALGHLNLKRLNSATGVPSLSREDVYKQKIFLPSLSEQLRIVSLLDRAAEIRRRAEAACDKAYAIIPALFGDMFGDPATNPKGWDLKELGEVLTSVQYGSSEKANEVGRGVPVIRMGNVTASGDLDTSDLKHIELEGKEYQNAELREGDILFNRTNSKELVGKTGLWDGRFEAVAASYFIRLRVDRERVAPEYVWCFMNTPHMKKVLFNTARGAIGQANINAKELRAFQLPLPGKQLQDRFAAELRSIRALTSRCAGAAAIASKTQSAISAEVFA